jgi:hypothetical protein
VWQSFSDLDNSSGGQASRDISEIFLRIEPMIEWMWAPRQLA